jgi:5'-nucleotidase
VSLRILLVNDDGIDAPGLGVMRKIAAELSNDVWVVAPDGNQSGASHRFTFGRELRLEERAHQEYAISHASPADCVVAAVRLLLKDQPPDLVLSGVNNGQNLGDIIHCSGTAAGAREAAMQGCLGIAMSQGVDYERGVLDAEWTNATRYGVEVVRGILESNEGVDTWYNVNFPYCAPEDVSGIRAVGHQRFSRSPMATYPSDNEGYFFISLPETPTPLDPEHDFHVLHHENAVTVTPLTLRHTDEDAVRRMAGTWK